MQNPVFWQEVTHQKRNAPDYMRYVNLLALGELLLILVCVPLTLTHFDTAMNSTVYVALFSAWVVNAAVAARAVIAGANTISREYIGQTWDALVLTGVSAWQILLGKWRAAMQRTGPWMLGLGTVRLVMLPVLLYSVTLRLSYFWAQRYSGGGYYGYYADEEFFRLTWVPEAAILAVVAAVVLTLLELAACTALGMAASALTRRFSAAAALALSIRFVPVALFAAFVRYDLGPNSFLWYRTPIFSIADGGTSPLYQFMVPVSPWTSDRHLPAASHLVLCILLYLGLIALGIGMTYIVVRRAGAMQDDHRREGAAVFRLEPQRLQFDRSPGQAD